MSIINVLDKNTIDKIAAGEVIERPANIVKELLENSIDAGASNVSVEIKDGGSSFIRVTDNGSGIEKDQIEKAFLRHATSKISSADDLSFINSLGFRGEALSSIAAVSKVEICTKVSSDMTGIIYKINGGAKVSFEEAGLPNGTTIIVQDIFYNTPARKKFLKSSQTEASYIIDYVNKLALSHPDISFKLICNGSVKVNTSGNGNLKDAIYAVLGRDLANNVLPVEQTADCLEINGFIGKPEVSRANRNYEWFFVNGRYVKDSTLSRAIEEAYKGYQMKGSFPFVVLNINIEPELMDVNVHPAKLEIRFYNNELIFNILSNAILQVLKSRDNIPDFQIKRDRFSEPVSESAKTFYSTETDESTNNYPEPFEINRILNSNVLREEIEYNQVTIPENFFISEKARIKHRLIGEVFDTYWIVEYDNSMYIIDQHAAHEKVLYEEFLEKYKNNTHYSQNIYPSMIISLNPTEENALKYNIEKLKSIGFEISHFGGSEYAISAIPSDFSSINNASLFLSFIDEISDINLSVSADVILEKIASAACKAAVKGGNRISFIEANALIDKLLSLDNPYNCPHGRPTIIKMSKNELERKFKRII